MPYGIKTNKKDDKDSFIFSGITHKKAPAQTRTESSSSMPANFVTSEEVGLRLYIQRSFISLQSRQPRDTKCLRVQWWSPCVRSQCPQCLHGTPSMDCLCCWKWQWFYYKPFKMSYRLQMRGLALLVICSCVHRLWYGTKCSEWQGSSSEMWFVIFDIPFHLRASGVDYVSDNCRWTSSLFYMLTLGEVVIYSSLYLVEGVLTSVWS